MFTLFSDCNVVRPGRTLFVRKVRIGDRDAPSPTLQLVFCHGTCGSEQQFLPLLQHLSQTVSTQTDNQALSSLTIDCVLYDFLSCGQSRPIVRDFAAYRNEESREDWQAILAHYTDNTRPIIIIGHSYAANVFLPWLARSDTTKSTFNVRGLVFLSTGVRTPSVQLPDGGHWIMRLPLFVLECLQPSLTRAFAAAAVHPQYSTIRHNIIHASNRNDMGVARAYHRHMTFVSADETTRAVGTLPCLVLHGVQDKVVPVQAGQELANLLPHSKFVTMEGTSHMIMLEDPQRVADELLAFLTELIKCNVNS